MSTVIPGLRTRHAEIVCIGLLLILVCVTVGGHTLCAFTCLDLISQILDGSLQRGVAFREPVNGLLYLFGIA